MKNEILETSLKQFLKYGIRKMSVQRLITPLGISTKTFYKYFENKEELLEQALHLYHANQYQALENLSADRRVVPLFFDIWYQAIEITYKVNKVFFHDLHYYYPELGKKIDGVVSKKYANKFIRIIEKGIQEKVFQQDIIPEIVLESIFILYSAIAREEKYKKFRIPPYQILLNTIALYMKGFCTPKGLRELEEYIRTFKTYEDVTAVKNKIPGNNL